MKFSCERSFGSCAMVDSRICVICTLETPLKNHEMVVKLF